MESGRLLVALSFSAMALGVNGFYTLRHPEILDDIADVDVAGPYEWL